MSADKYPCLFSRQMAAIVYIFWREMETIVCICVKVFAKRDRPRETWRRTVKRDVWWKDLEPGRPLRTRPHIYRSKSKE